MLAPHDSITAPPYVSEEPGQAPVNGGEGLDCVSCDAYRLVVARVGPVGATAVSIASAEPRCVVGMFRRARQDVTSP